MEQSKKILFVVANEGFQQTEYHTPKKIVEQAGFTVTTASDKLSPAIAKDGSTVPVDVLLNQVNPKQYAGIFFIGGPGALEHLDNEASYKLLKNSAHAEIPIGGICLATRILVNAGVLDEKKATGYNNDNKLEELFKKHTIQYVHQPVVIDENIITAIDQNTAVEFGNAIVKVINQNK